MKHRKCPDCFTQFPFVARKLFCGACAKKRYGHIPNTTKPKTPARAGVDSGSSREVDTRGQHSEGPIWVHRPGGSQGQPDPRSTGNELQQHFSESPKDRRKRIIVGSTESLLASLGYRMAQTK